MSAWREWQCSVSFGWLAGSHRLILRYCITARVTGGKSFKTACSHPAVEVTEFRGVFLLPLQFHSFIVIFFNIG